MVYEILLTVGVLGFLAMVLAGMVHGHGGNGNGHGNGAHGHAGFGDHGGHAGSHGVAHGHAGADGAAHGHAQAGHHADAQGAEKGFHSWLVISPLDLFTLALGAGAVGMAFRGMLGSVPLAIAAFFGALVFDFLLVKPLIKLIFKFSSTPSEGIEGKLASDAEATCSFDESGKGVVKLILDGQIVQLLGQLEQPEIEAGIRVHKGDVLTITQVDSTKGTCRVTRELHE